MPEHDHQDPRLLALADAILEGIAVDWSAEAQAPGLTQGLIRELATIASLTPARPMPDDDPVARVERAGRWGSFRLLALIARGSQGATYRATDVRLDREVALKLLPDRIGCPDADLVVEEARLLARVRHPNVVTVHAAEREAGCTGIVMELVSGRTLEAILAEDGPLPAREAAFMGAEVCRALSAVHLAGVLHRDVKAQNVLRAETGRIVLADFGSGRERVSGVPARDSAGTPLYLAPELLEGEVASLQSDVYSAGVLLFHLVTGRWPIEGASIAALREAHRRGTRFRLRDLRPDLPRPFVDIVEHALAPLPADRFGTAAKMEEALVAFLRPQPMPRGRLLAAAGPVLVLTVAFAWWGRRTPAPPLRFAEREWVLVGEVENLTGDPVLDGTLRFALESELANSERLGVIPPERVHDALKLMRRPPGTPLSRDVALELSQRDGGVRAVVTGRVEKVGGSYLLSASVTDAASRATVLSLREKASAEAGLLAAVERTSTRLRVALGEDLARPPKAAPALEKVTTSSLRALQLYSLGMEHMARVPMENERALELFSRAVAEDPEFAMAHLLRGFALSNLGQPAAEVGAAARRAHALLGQATSEYERYFLLGGYHHLLDSRWRAFDGGTAEVAMHHAQQALLNFDLLLRTRPTDYWAAHKLRMAAELLYRHPGEAVVTKLAEARPRNFEAQSYAAQYWVSRGDFARAESYVDRARAARGSVEPFLDAVEMAWIDLLPAYRAWLQDDVTRAEQEADRAATRVATLSGAERDGFVDVLGNLYLTLGQLEKAESLFSSLPVGEMRHDGWPRDLWMRTIERERLAQPAPDSIPGADLRLLTSVYLPFRDVARAKAQLPSRPDRLQNGFTLLSRGRIALGEARGQDAAAALHAFFALTGRQDPAVAHQMLEAWTGLALVAIAQGNLPEAIRILEEARVRRTWALLFDGMTAGVAWLHGQELLAGLYRATGRLDEADRVFGQLRTLLARADRGHPVVLRLEKRAPLR